MNSAQRTRYPRGQLSSRWQGSTPKPQRFAISIDRPIIWDGGEGETTQAEYLQTAADAIKEVGQGAGKRQSRIKRPEYDIIKPDDLRLVHIQPEALATQALDMFLYHDRRNQMERLARMLQEMLHAMYKDQPSKLPIKLGQLCLGLNKNKANYDLESGPIDQTIVARPIGWHGHGANYDSQDPYKSTLGLLASEGVFYQEAIREINPYFEPKDIVTDPRAAVMVRKRGSVPPGELNAIGMSFATNGVTPYETFIGDPVVNVIRLTDSSSEVLEQLSIRDLGRNPIAA